MLCVFEAHKMADGTNGSNGLHLLVLLIARLRNANCVRNSLFL